MTQISRNKPPPTPVNTPQNTSKKLCAVGCRKKATRTPTAVNTPNPIASAINKKFLYAFFCVILFVFTLKYANKNTITEVTLATTTYTGLENALGGTLPSTISRIIPPNVAVITPIITTPKKSIFDFIATSAPEIANAMVPTISNINMY